MLKEKRDVGRVYNIIMCKLFDNDPLPELHSCSIGIRRSSPSSLVQKGRWYCFLSILFLPSFSSQMNRSSSRRARMCVLLVSVLYMVFTVVILIKVCAHSGPHPSAQPTVESTRREQRQTMWLVLVNKFYIMFPLAADGVCVRQGLTKKISCQLVEAQ